jgi:hypothetical protein
MLFRAVYWQIDVRCGGEGEHWSVVLSEREEENEKEKKENKMEEEE